MPPAYNYRLPSSNSTSGYLYPLSFQTLPGLWPSGGSSSQTPTEKIDDWKYVSKSTSEISYSGMGGSIGYGLSTSYGGSFSGYSGLSGSGSYSSSPSIGYSTGGAKDVNNFRTNIENNFLPIPTDITYEGLFYDYYFDTGRQEECQNLFCPSYSLAVSLDPFSGEEEYYMSVGLNSGIGESDFQRKRLNLVIV